MFYKTSRYELSLIRDVAAKFATQWSDFTRYNYRVVRRRNVKDSRRAGINMFLVTDGEFLGDTGLDGYRPLRDMKNIKMTVDGRALVDVSVSESGKGNILVCNVQAEFDCKGIKAIHADEVQNVWVRR